MNYTDQQLIEILDRLRSQPAENEILEFKKAENGYDFTKIGKYFSALSNEANLKGQPNAWLIFGIDDKTHQIVGSNFRRNRKDLDSLKGEIAKHCTNQITFIEIYELMLPKGRVVMFQIPSAPQGIPLAFEGHYYGRNGESLTALNLEEIERIRIQNRLFDWSSLLVPNATLEDLDPEAIEKARTEFKEKYPAKKNQIDDWDDATFLNKAKITLQGKITNAAIILLGRPESSTLLSPSVAMISWILKDDKNREKDYKHFGPPYLLNAKKVLENVRNLTIRHLPSGTIFPLETSQYDPWVLREALITVLLIKITPYMEELMS
jgi:ATP-dependent DNA helicase RecG